ncbi:MAG: tRNA pseudouridine(38-40) synthase TruA [Planctomycetota bacterium]
MPRVRLTVAYDGTAYSGFQRQPNGRTIQEELEKALARVAGAVTIAGSGRTDAGVHAQGQVVHFDTDAARAPAEILRSANFYLPEDIAILEASEAAPDFHARTSAKSKRYRYTFWNDPVRPVLERRYVCHVPTPLDLPAMQAAAAHLEGEHDFRSFASEIEPNKNAVRRISSILLARDEARIHLDVEANGFLYNMVRAIAGTLLDIGRGKHPPDWIREVVYARDRRAAGETAEAKGLCLMRVDYPAAPAGRA